MKVSIINKKKEVVTRTTYLTTLDLGITSYEAEGEIGAYCEQYFSKSTIRSIDIRRNVQQGVWEFDVVTVSSANRPIKEQGC